MLNNSKIYSIHTESNRVDLIEVETIILNGLYRFSILGINQKNYTDTKDRIYSALRSQKLVNLKSDNKKITVNLLPTNINKKTNIYDLSIALSCLSCMGQINIDEDTIVIGELSILGNIIPGNFILRSIYQAIKNNIKIIVCTQVEMDRLDKNKMDIQKLIIENNIKFISSNNLGDLINNIKNNNYSVLKGKENQSISKSICNNIPDINQIKIKSCKDLNINILKIIVAICTKRNIFIENTKNSFIKKYIDNLIYYNKKLNPSEILRISNILNLCDDQILETYTYPKVSILDSQTQKNDLSNLLNISYFGFNIIEDFLNMSEESMYIIKKYNSSSILCFYNTCPCGNSNVFFNNIGNNKCFCLQRNILKYRQRLQKIENGFFDFHINTAYENSIEYISDDYIKVNNIISKFRNTEVEIIDEYDSHIFIEKNINLLDRAHLDKILCLAKDIAKLNHILTEEEPKLNQENIDLAIELLKKDF